MYTIHPLYWKYTSTWTLKIDQSLSVNALHRLMFGLLTAATCGTSGVLECPL